jgi:hypothetical protein
VTCAQPCACFRARLKASLTPRAGFPRTAAAASSACRCVCVTASGLAPRAAAEGPLRPAQRRAPRDACFELCSAQTSECPLAPGRRAPRDACFELVCPLPGSASSRTEPTILAMLNFSVHSEQSRRPHRSGEQRADGPRGGAARAVGRLREIALLAGRVGDTTTIVADFCGASSLAASAEQQVHCTHQRSCSTSARCGCARTRRPCSPRQPRAA